MEKCAKERQRCLTRQCLQVFLQINSKRSTQKYVSSTGEMRVVRAFIENFLGDQVRYLAKGLLVLGDNLCQQSDGNRWPYGPVAIIAPFNFPLEIPILQILGGLFKGNKVLLKPEPKVALAAEEFLRFLHGMPVEDADLLNSKGEAAEKMVRDGLFRNIQFTGSSKITNHLTILNKGRIKIENLG